MNYTANIIIGLAVLVVSLLLVMHRKKNPGQEPPKSLRIVFVCVGLFGGLYVLANVFEFI